MKMDKSDKFCLFAGLVAIALIGYAFGIGLKEAKEEYLKTQKQEFSKFEKVENKIVLIGLYDKTRLLCVDGVQFIDDGTSTKQVFGPNREPVSCKMK